MKDNLKLLIGFLSIIVLISIQMGITYKLQTDFHEDILLIKEVELPLKIMIESLISYDSIRTSEINSIILHLNNGDVEEIKEHRLKYEENKIKIDNILEKDAKILIIQSKRSKEIKDNAFADMNQLNQLNLKLKELETKIFDAVEKNDLDMVFYLSANKDYHETKKEFYQNSLVTVNTKREWVSGLQNNIIEKSNDITYINLGISITIIILVILTLLILRSFVTKFSNTKIKK